MIIIEGVDNSGKTVLGKKLSEHFDFPLVHSPGHCPEMVEWAKKALQEDEVKIYDRFPIISEAVYGPILRGNDSFDSKEGEKVLTLFLAKKPLIIYCKPPDEIIKRKLGEQMEGVKEHLDDLINSYGEHMRFLQDYDFYVVVYDYTDPFTEKIVKTVIKAYLEKLREKEIFGGKHN